MVPVRSVVGRFPLNVVAVITPENIAFPSTLSVVAAPGKPISIPDLAVINPIASMLVTSS